MRKIPKSVVLLFDTICARAEGSHPLAQPLDREVVYKFIVACHRAGTKLNEHDFREHLKQKGIACEIAEDLANLYRTGRDLLSVYRHGTAYPPQRPNYKGEAVLKVVERLNQGESEFEIAKTLVKPSVANLEQELDKAFQWVNKISIFMPERLRRSAEQAEHVEDR